MGLIYLSSETAMSGRYLQESYQACYIAGEGRKPLVIFKHTWQNNIKMDWYRRDLLGECRLDLSGSTLGQVTNCFGRGTEHVTSINGANFFF